MCNADIEDHGDEAQAAVTPRAREHVETEGGAHEFRPAVALGSGLRRLALGKLLLALALATVRDGLRTT